jgi:ribose transport system ATP-binding protein
MLKAVEKCMKTILKMTNITKTFPGLTALDNVSLEINKGEIHGLVGENGAGKSTLMKILSGAYISDTGSVEIEGEVIRDISPRQMIKKGVAVIYQELMLAPHMTVAENIFLGRIPKKMGFVNYRLMEKETKKICEEIGLYLDPSSLVRDLNVAKRQMVEIVKALSRNAKIIVLDEPTAVLGENELRGMFEIVRKLSKNGVTFIYISHRLKEVFELVDRVTIMKDGLIVDTDDIKNFDVDKLVKKMVGRDLINIYPERIRTYNGEALKVSGLTRKNVLYDISFTLHKGEILAISGLAGAGRTEILKAIIGADRIDSGDIEVFGKKVKINSPRDAIRYGIGLLPEDRKGEGLFLRQKVLFNVTITKFSDFLNLFFLNLKKEKSIVSEFIKKINIKTTNADVIVKNLSGGNQQKVVFSKWLNAQCKILFIDEPTRGIDVGSKSEIYYFLSQLAQNGTAILMVSSELPEVLGVSNRVLVMHEGKIAAEFPSDSVTEEEIMMYATGQAVR